MSCLFTFVREGTMHAEFNSVVLFTVLYSRFQHCAKDVSTFTAQPTILELGLQNTNMQDAHFLGGISAKAFFSSLGVF